MTNRVFRIINRFFEGTGASVSTPSGDARGHLSPYPQKTVARGRDL
jgi:hypothetical protein